MDAALKRILKAVTLELRHLLEGRYDSEGKWKPGDLEQRLAAIGVRRDRASLPVDELGHLVDEDRQARRVIDAYLKLREEAGVERAVAVAEFVRETSYTWANRLLALRCMEARELIDAVILQQEAYGGRSLEHHRLAQRNPELCAGDDDGLFALLDKVFREQAERLPMLFDPQAPGIALRPAPAALKDCFGLLSLNPDTLRKYRIRLKEEERDEAGTEPPNPFTAPDALGWAYQYWNTEEKDRVFEKVRTVKGAKIAGSDIVPATQLYTEDYMVKFLVQNSLGATWMGMHPNSKLPLPSGSVSPQPPLPSGGEGPGEGAGGWEYYVKDADRAPVEKKPVREITFLDPACGSGHFLLEAFDLFFAMYQEKGELTNPEEICDSILTNNLFGIDIDPRAVQIAEAALWMKAAERAFDYKGAATNLVAATASHLKGEAWEEFLAGFDREPSVARVLRKFAQTMEHIDEIGSLARPAEDLHEIIRQEHATWERQVRERKEANYLFPEIRAEALKGHLPFQEISDEQFGHRLFNRAQFALDDFTKSARERGEFDDQMLASETRAGFRLMNLLSGQFDVVAANPPYMGSQSMGPVLQDYIVGRWRTAKRDLYAAFIARTIELSASGRVALVSQQAWLFLKQMRHLRGHVLPRVSVEALAHLGPGAFEEISGAHVNVVLFIASNIGLLNGHRVTAIRPSWLSGPGCVAQQLRQAASSSDSSIRFRTLQQDLLDLPNSPFVYWCSTHFLRLLKPDRTLDSAADVTYTASANQRFVRCRWEVGNHDRWLSYSKGGGFQKWSGLNTYAVDWGHNGERVAALVRDRYPPDKFSLWIKQAPTETDCLVWSEVGSGSMGARRCRPRTVISRTGPSVISQRENGWKEHLLLLNSHVATYLLRLCCSGLHFAYPYVAKLPLPRSALEVRIIDPIVTVSEFLASLDLVEGECDVVRVMAIGKRGETSHVQSQDLCRLQALLHTMEGVAEEIAFGAFEIGKDDATRVISDTGTPVGWFPLISGYDTPLDSRVDGAMLSTDVCDRQAKYDRQAVPSEKLEKVRANLQALYAAGPGAKCELGDEASESGSDDEEDVEIVGVRIPIPPTTFMQELCERLEVHPISVYSLLKEGIENAGWRCLPEERRLWSDRITVTVLRLLGHRWPKQVEAGEPVPDWADPDGIIPLTPLAKESMLFERVQQRLRADEIDASDFAEVMGKPLDAWLATEFFKHHTKQFKKRPIAWQLQSGKFTARTSPAFACLLYYHKLDKDTLPKLRSQYVGPLRQRLETELRGIQAVAAGARSDRQEKRRVELDDAIRELTDFDARLEQLSRQGFATAGLAKLLADEPLDRWCSLDGKRPHPTTAAELIAQESAYAPDINDGVRVNIAPLQKAGLLAADVLAKKDLDKAIVDRAQWRADERRWVREAKLPQPGWWPADNELLADGCSVMDETR